MLRAFASIVLLSCFAVSVTHAQRFDPLRDFNQRFEEQRMKAAKIRQEMEARSKAMRDQLKNIPLGPPGFPNANRPAAPNSAIPPAMQSRNQLEAGGLQIPAGAIKYSNGESVLVRDEQGDDVVGRLHVTVGKTRMVLMPDGLLKTFPLAETRDASESFVPMDMNAIEAKLLKDPKLAGFKTIRSRRFLYVYNTSDIFIRSTRTILESMYPAVRKYFSRSGIDIHEPELPLVVIAFATDDQFQQYRPMPNGIVAYYDGISNGVFLYERSELSDHAPEIAVKNAISTIAHEGAHQILHNIGVQQRLSRWPLWLSEGLAEFYAPTTVQKGVRWSGLGSTNQLRMLEISRDWEANSPTANGQTVGRITSAEQLTSLDYAYAWGLIHMLSRQHQKELFACIRQCSELRPLDGTELVTDQVDSASEVFVKHFGSEYSTIERELGKHLTSLNYVDPVKTQTHYLVVSGSRVTLTTSPEKVKELQRHSFGTFRVQKFPNRMLAEQAMAAITK